MSHNCVYLIENIKTGKFYVGSTGNPRQRIKRHLYKLRKNTHHCTSFQRDYTDPDDLKTVFVIVETRGQAYELEQLVLSEMLPTGLIYNVGSGVNGGDNLTYNPNKQRIVAAMSKAMKKRWQKASPEDKEKISRSRSGSGNAMFGRTHTPESRKKISLANSGRSSKNKGISMSPEQKVKLLAHVAKRDYWGKNNPFYGKQHTQEVREKLSAAFKGRQPVNSRKVSAGGTVYVSLAKAAKAHGITIGAAHNRVKSNRAKYSDWFYITEMSNDHPARE